MIADGEQGGVTQADRNAAAKLFGKTDWSYSQFVTGKRDKDEKVLAFMRHRVAHAATDTPDVVRKAVDLAYDLLMEVEQTRNNVWWVNVDDPEVAVCDTLDALEEARFAIALSKDPAA